MDRYVSYVGLMGGGNGLHDLSVGVSWQGSQRYKASLVRSKSAPLFHPALPPSLPQAESPVVSSLQYSRYFTAYLHICIYIHSKLLGLCNRAISGSRRGAHPT